MAYIGLDTTKHERTMGGGGNTPLPAGFYSGVVTRAEVRDNSPNAKDPNGKYLEVEFDITSPSDFSNRKFWDKFNLININEIAVKIGKEQLSDLAQSMDIANLGDSEELLGKECCFYLTIKPAQGQYSASNNCMKYLPVGTSEADYQEWLATKKGGASKVGKAPERKAWGAKDAPAAEAAPVDTDSGAKTPPWKK